MIDSTFPPKEWNYERTIAGSPHSRFDFHYISKFNFESWMLKLKDDNFIYLDIEDYVGILCQKHVDYHKTGKIQLKDMRNLRRILNEKIAEFGSELFVRLSYRSAKDVPEGRTPIMDSEQVLKAIIKSERCFDDMIAHKYHKLNGVDLHKVDLPHLGINLVPWKKCVVERELRCFVHNKTLVAITFQILTSSWPFAGLEKYVVESIHKFVKELWDKHTLYNSAVIDVELNASLECELIEFNPYGEKGSTSAVLFHWVDDEDILFNDEPKYIVLRYTAWGRPREMKYM